MALYALADLHLAKDIDKPMISSVLCGTGIWSASKRTGGLP